MAGDAENRPKFEHSSENFCCFGLEGVVTGLGPLTTCSGALGGDINNGSEMY
jgi:hypothetical protein